ncbi:GFA family protein [Bradyrhizobium viridifuturi]|nr:GFA family protein [Bradyrhizobium viridifuturi]MBR1044968.1 GFA family protein [Bradyrhizobium viridifuturi]MBR1084087.1 GFA family protein [Bradyrhizobium viridifuturi]MBR1096364.1 GFA family protein [Bradyrhizobium viridifuturi]MBR1103446.1 GFA family protein [Bradyrhizobium viridifuturi]
MSSALLGGCACGAVRYEIRADPILMMNCHCRDCQRVNGTAYAAIVVVADDAIWMNGELNSYKVLGESGKETRRKFCRRCGGQVAVELDIMPGRTGVHAGTLDDPSRYHPSLDLYVSSAQPWDQMLPHTEKFAKLRSRKVSFPSCQDGQSQSD